MVREMAKYKLKNEGDHMVYYKSTKIVYLKKIGSFMDKRYISFNNEATTFYNTKGNFI